MTFDLLSWLEEQGANRELDIPLFDVANGKADDHREWFVTNGLGSYASANIWGANTRRYHGLFVAALEPPVRRHLLFSRVDERVDGKALSTNHWTSGIVSPEGFKHIEAFTIYPVPTWLFQVDTGHLIKQVAMLQGEQAVFIGYTWIGNRAVHLSLDLLANFRDFHSRTQGSPDWFFLQDVESGKITVRAYASAQQFVLTFDRGVYNQEPSWYYNYYWPKEHERGLEYQEDNFHIGRLEVDLSPGQSVMLRVGLDVANTAAPTRSISDVVRQVSAHQKWLLNKASNPSSQDVQRLVIAASSFVVERRSTSSNSIIAGYHWFADWGRDAMISLPGLTIATGQLEAARGILKTFGQYLSEGMLPNNFPDSGLTPQYNTSDATFWWGWALYRYFQATNDTSFVRSQLPLLDEVIRWHCAGTRYGLHVDDVDGLLTGGTPGIQLTWMDAKVGDFVVTPRNGKAVEINALWYNFLKVLEHFHALLGDDAASYAQLAAKTKAGFTQFWNEAEGCLFDVIRTDGSKDASIRPNQVLALSLPFELVTRQKAQSILTVVEQELLTPYGLRTLGPKDGAYKGQYGLGNAVANQYDRDITYHQGTVWPWLFGPWVDARIRIYGATKENFIFISERLKTIQAHFLGADGLGSIQEIFDGDAPHHAKGCIAQAWSVAELLRVLTDYPQLLK